jgi:hypothetical protein
MELTISEIVDETIAFYQKNPRSIGINGYGEITCAYNGPNGEKCAFSRCCTTESKFDEGHNAISQVSAVLLPQYQGHSLMFWNALQQLHDNDNHWNRNELTDAGIAYANEIKSSVYDTTFE